MSEQQTEIESRLNDVAVLADNVATTIAGVIKGKSDAIELLIVAALAGGHVLVEDVPGVGKTSLARALAKSFDARWSRIQFTPDLLPSDVTGGDVYREHSGNFEFHPGPVFAHIVVADEINRASPKTQSALLEVMEERSVTVGNHTHQLPLPFMVVATQNPIEMDGTYRLPEAQLDRFLMRVSIGYPDLAAEIEVLEEDGAAGGIEAIVPVATPKSLQNAIEAVSMVHVSPALREYVARIAGATRNIDEIRLGCSPRGSLSMLRAARARAAVHGRNHATADDVKTLAAVILPHRLILSSHAALSQITAEQLTKRVLDTVPVPTNVS